MADFVYDQIEATNIKTGIIDTVSAQTLYIGTSNATDITIGTGSTNVTIAGSIFAPGTPAKGSILAGNGTSFGDVIVSFPADEGRVLVARAAAGRGLAWETVAGGGGSPVSWLPADINTTITLSPVATVDTDRSEYGIVNTNMATLNLDLDLTTDGTGPSSSLQFDIPVAKGISAAGASGTRYTSTVWIDDGSSVALGVLWLDSGVGSGDRVTVTTTGLFENNTSYRILGNVSYRI